MCPDDITTNIHQISSIADQQVNEAIGKTWVDIEEERRNETAHLCLTRIVFVCLISSECFSVEKATKLHEIFNFTDEHDDPTMGGILLIAANEQEDANPCAAFGFLEFKRQNDVQKCMGVLAGLTNFDSSLLGFHSMKILLISVNNISQQFTEFGIYLASPQADENIDIAEYGPVAFEDTMVKFYEQCSLLVDIEEHPKCKELKILTGSKWESLPSANRIKHFALSDRYPSPSEFVEIFNSRVDLEAEFENLSTGLPIINWEENVEIVEK